MKFLRPFIACSLLVVPSALWAQNVKAGYDHAANFSKFHTYTWTKGFPAAQERINSRIVTDTEQQLASRGLQRVEGEADLLVSYSAGVDQEFSYGPSMYVRGPNWGGFWADWAPTSSSGVLKGQILVELVEPRSKQCVWRALATDNISDSVRNNPDALMKKISKMVEKLFTKFPERK
jgi:Domain of unknown function (DUF4136)